MTEPRQSPAVQDAASPAQTWNTSLYDTHHSFVSRYGSDLVGLLAPQPGERILDLGCGTGHLAKQIADSGATVLGMDQSAEMVAQARAHYPDLTFLVGSATDFTVEEPFDAIFSNATLHWVKPPEDAAKRMAAALKPGGRLVAEFGGKGNIQGLLEGFYQGLEAAGIPNGPDLNPWYYPGIAEYASLLERHGMETQVALLFGRMTELSEGERGMRNWLEMFTGPFMAHVPEDRKEMVLQTTEDALRPTLFHGGSWWADYRRLRIVAVKV